MAPASEMMVFAVAASMLSFTLTTAALTCSAVCLDLVEPAGRPGFALVSVVVVAAAPPFEDP